MAWLAKTIAVKNVDEELYRRVKAVAALEGRTLGSVVNEALRMWLSTRCVELLDEWARLEEAYRRNVEALKEKAEEILGEHEEGFVLACNGVVQGVFGSFEEAARRAEEVCEAEALIVEVSALREMKERVVELGFPVSIS